MRVGVIFPRRSNYRLYRTYGESAAAASGYDDTRIAALVAAKTTRFAGELGRAVPEITPHTLRHLYALSLTAAPHPAVLELGGACGAAFLEVEAVAPGLTSSWTVLESATMAEAAERAGLGSNRLSFTTALPPAPVEVVLAQGSLQYVDDPLELLTSLLAHGPAVVAIGRTTMSDGNHAHFATQRSNLADHGPGPAPPGIDARGSITTTMTVLPRSAYGSALDDVGYEVLAWVREGPFPLRRRGPAARVSHWGCIAVPVSKPRGGPR